MRLSKPPHSLPPPNFGLLSDCAAHLRKKVSRRSHMSGTLLFPQSFTVRDLKHALHACLATLDRGHEADGSLTAAMVSSLELQEFFYIRFWKDMALADDDDVCLFLYCDKEEAPPTGVFPTLVKCYSPTCEESGPCYSPSCPNSARRRAARLSSANVPKCYSPTCDRSRGCYSPTCPHRYLDGSVSPDGTVDMPIRGSPLSSNGPPTPTEAPPPWTDHSPPCSDRPRRSLSSYLEEFSTEDALTHFWFGTAGLP